MTKKRVIAFLCAVIFFFSVAFTVAYVTADHTYTATQHAYIEVDLPKGTHPYIALSASSTAAWFFVDAAPTATNAANETIRTLGLDMTAQELLDLITVTRREKNTWITVTATHEKIDVARDILDTFVSFLYADVNAAAQSNLPYKAWHILNATEIQNNFSLGTVFLISGIATAVLSLLLGYVHYCYAQYQMKRQHALLLDVPKREVRKTWFSSLGKTARRIPLRILSVFLIVTLSMLLLFQFVAPNRYRASQRVCLFLLEEDVYTTEMILGSQEYLKSYESYLSHPVTFRAFYQNLPSDLTAIMTEKEVIECFELESQLPAGVYGISFITADPELSSRLTTAFVDFVFEYLCDFFDLGVTKKVGIHPERSQDFTVWDKVTAVGIGAGASAVFLCASDLYTRLEQKRLRKRFME
jgi:capsular polysaccharide biosynthesis protein